MKFKEIFEANKYTIAHGDGENIEVEFASTPKDAIKKWVKGEIKHPSDSNISAENKEDAKALYAWAHENKEEFIKIISKQKSMKTKYIYQEVQAINVDKMSDFDNLHPFTVG